LTKKPGLIEKYYVRGGKFWIDGMHLADVLAKHPTPCYVYSASVIRDKFARLTAQFPGFEVFFSFKANPNLAIGKTALALGANADVSSLGELKAALKAGFKPENILFVGPAKTEEELRYAIANGIYAVVAESPYELELADRIAGRLKRRPNVMLRVNTLEKPTAAEIMVGGPSKFGMDEETIVDAVRGVALKHSQIIGTHVYSASQVLDSGFISNHITYVGDLSLRLSKALGFELKCIDFGGGFGVPYKDGEDELELGPIAAAAEATRRKVLAASPGCRLAFEVGRYLVAEAGVFLTRVARIKQSRGKVFVITDAGMNHFTRPIFQRLNHPVRILDKIAEEPVGVANIGGPICTPLDVSGKEVALPAPALGDVVGFFNAGAYGYTMSMVNFMSLGWPAEVMIDTGRSYVIRKARLAEDFFDDQPLK
jgi:diaminopimelate decarboxylase